MQFKKIINNFFKGYSDYKIHPVNGGNINTTYLISINFKDTSFIFLFYS